MRQCSSGDPEIVRADELTLGRQLSPNVCMNSRDLFGDLDRSNPAKQVLYERSAPRALSPTGAVHTV